MNCSIDSKLSIWSFLDVVDICFIGKNKIFELFLSFDLSSGIMHNHLSAGFSFRLHSKEQMPCIMFLKQQVNDVVGVPSNVLVFGKSLDQLVKILDLWVVA